MMSLKPLHNGNGNAVKMSDVRNGGGRRSVSSASPVSNGSGSSNGKVQNSTNACMLVNGNQRRLSNSYLRYQRRYSKHGCVKQYELDPSVEEATSIG